MNSGHSYFIKDSFYKIVNEPNLMQNKKDDGDLRPHFFMMKDEKTNLYWMIPVSHEVEKAKNTIQRQQEKNYNLIALKIVKFQGEERALLLRSMFPINQFYIKQEYTRRNQSYSITNKKVLNEIKELFSETKKFLEKGYNLSKYPIDIKKIESIIFSDKDSIKQLLKEKNFETSNECIKKIAQINLRENRFSTFEELNEKISIDVLKENGFKIKNSVIEEVMKLNIKNNRFLPIEEINHTFSVDILVQKNFIAEESIVKDIMKLNSMHGIFFTLEEINEKYVNRIFSSKEEKLCIDNIGEKLTAQNEKKLIISPIFQNEDLEIEI